MSIARANQKVQENIQNPNSETFAEAIWEISSLPCKVFAQHPKLRKTCCFTMQKFQNHSSLTEDCVFAFEALCSVIQDSFKLQEFVADGDHDNAVFQFVKNFEENLQQEAFSDTDDSDGWSLSAEEEEPE